MVCNVSSDSPQILTISARIRMHASNSLTHLSFEAQLKILELHKKANAGHIAVSLSCIQILTAIVHGLMDKQLDTMILSKGHAASALYVVLNQAGLLAGEPLESFYQEGTTLAAHPPCSSQVTSIPFGTGSLGHGLSLAAGIALGARMRRSTKHVYAVLSDGELNEGSTWEAVMFAAHHRLNNLTIFIDNNGLQGLGETKDILDLGDISRKFADFGWDVITVERGNDPDAIVDSSRRGSFGGRPRALICKTVKGSGVRFMEGKYQWHYLPLSEEDYISAVNDLRNRYEEGILSVARNNDS